MTNKPKNEEFLRKEFEKLMVKATLISQKAFEHIQMFISPKIEKENEPYPHFEGMVLQTLVFQLMSSMLYVADENGANDEMLRGLVDQCGEFALDNYKSMKMRVEN